MRRYVLWALAAAALVILATAVTAGAGPASRPFKGSMTGTVTFVQADECPVPKLRTVGAATGTASHLGRFSYESSHCSGFTFAGSQVIVAANGDELYADYATVGPPVPLPPDVGTVFDVVNEFTITGGTGRFEHATGGGFTTAHVTYMGIGVPVWPASWDWQGTIGY